MNTDVNQDECTHENMELCDDCGKPMCADCGAACTCNHKHGKVLEE